MQVLADIESVSPLSNHHLIFSDLVLKTLLCIFDQFIDVISMLQIVTLNLGHRQFELWHLVGEFMSSLSMIWEHILEKLNHLVVRGVIQMSMEVGSTWSEKSWVKIIFVVCSHENHLSFFRSYSVKSVKQS